MPCLLTGALVFLNVADPYGDWGHFLGQVASQIQHVALIAAFAWLLARLVEAVEVSLVERYEQPRGAGEPFGRTRRQLSRLRKGLLGIIAWTATALVLTSFAELRPVGTFLLVSAGAIGILFGIAARHLLANLLAGIHVRFNELLHVGDIVVINRECGTVEEVNLTHVVLRLRNRRLLTVPIGHVAERPFERWTPDSPQVRGTVTLWVERDTEVEVLRRAFLEAVRGSSLWDGGVANLQVVELSESGIEIQGVVSATDPERLWELRCHVREAMGRVLRGVTNAWQEPRIGRFDDAKRFPDNSAVTPSGIDVRRT